MASELIIKNKLDSDQLIKIAPFKKEIRKTHPHKHNNYFEIIYLSAGTGCHAIDLVKYPVTPPLIYFVRQEQVHYWELDSEPEGYVIIVKKKFIEKSMDSELKALFTRTSAHTVLTLKEVGMLERMFELLVEEARPEPVPSFPVIEGLLKSLLAKVIQVAEPVMSRTETKPDLCQALTEMLASGGGIRNKVAYYAERLNTSPQNLNAACRKSANQPASEIISGFVLGEAKRLLLYTDKTIAEIAFALDFTDPSHFGKYFKKAVGATPAQFRHRTMDTR